MATRTKTQCLGCIDADSHGLIRVEGARVNNLEDVSVELERSGRSRGISSVIGLTSVDDR
jgi:hypothetical protein